MTVLAQSLVIPWAKVKPSLQGHSAELPGAEELHL